jgi:hypothetical protein
VRKTCPECAENAKTAARVCRYCGFRFELPRPRGQSPPARGSVDSELPRFPIRRRETARSATSPFHALGHSGQRVGSADSGITQARTCLCTCTIRAPSMLARQSARKTPEPRNRVVADAITGDHAAGRNKALVQIGARPGWPTDERARPATSAASRCGSGSRGDWAGPVGRPVHRWGYGLQDHAQP